MAIQYSTAVRDARLEAVEATLGTTPLLRMYSGSMPANPATAASGTLLAELTLPSDWMGASSDGVKSKSGTWQDLSANNDGTLGYFRLLDVTGTDCGVQGTISLTGDGGDMIVDNTSVRTGQQIVVSTFTLTTGNA